LPDFDEVPVRLTHGATPFPSVIVERLDVKSTHDHNSMIATKYLGFLTQR